MLTDHDGHSYQVIIRYGELCPTVQRIDGAVVSPATAAIVRSPPRHRRMPLFLGHLHVIGTCRVRYVIGVLPWHHIQTGLTKETLIFHSKWGPFLMPTMHFHSSLFVGSRNTLTITSYQSQLLLHHMDINQPNFSEPLWPSGQVFNGYTEGPSAKVRIHLGLRSLPKAARVMDI